jgi:hypothetical protein
MAVEPLYNETLDSLLKRARIATADDDQTLALVYQAVTEVRLGFYRKITKTRATTIAGYSLVDNPTSDEEILKAQAAATEANWLTWILAQRLPHLFMDNRASTGDMWNEEQLTRDTAASKEFLDQLWNDIELGLGDLEEPPSENSGPTKSASVKNTETYSPFSPSRGLYPNGTNNGVGGLW